MRTPWPSLCGSRARRSMPARKAARVFPDPVGAQISAFLPEAIAGQPPAWAGVGASNEASNHALTGVENGASACSAVAFSSVANPSILRIGRSGKTRGYFFFFFFLYVTGTESLAAAPRSSVRSEERRVGKEW